MRGVWLSGRERRARIPAATVVFSYADQLSRYFMDLTKVLENI